MLSRLSAVLCGFCAEGGFLAAANFLSKAVGGALPGFLKNSCASFSCCASDWRIKERGCWFSSCSWSRTCFFRGGWLASRGSCVLERLPETGWMVRKGELTAFELLASGSRLLDMLDRADRVAMYRWCAGVLSLCVGRLCTRLGRALLGHCRSAVEVTRERRLKD